METRETGRKEGNMQKGNKKSDTVLCLELCANTSYNIVISHFLVSWGKYFQKLGYGGVEGNSGLLNAVVISMPIIAK